MQISGSGRNIIPKYIISNRYYLQPDTEKTLFSVYHMTAQGENRTSLKAGSLTNTLSYFVQLFRYQFYGRGHVHSAWCPFGLMAPRPPPRDTQFVRQIKSNLVDTLRPSLPAPARCQGYQEMATDMNITKTVLKFSLNRVIYVVYSYQRPNEANAISVRCILRI